MLDLSRWGLDATRAEFEYRHAAAAAAILRSDGLRARRWPRRRLAHRAG